MGALSITVAIACHLALGDEAALLLACKERVGQAGIDACDALLRLDVSRDTKAEAHLQAGFKLLNLNKCEEAERHYREAATLAGENQHFFFRWGQSLECLGRLEAAAHAYSEAVRLDREDGGPVIRLGDILVRLGRYSEARTLFEAAIQRDQQDPALFVRLGRIYELEGHSERAVEAFRRVLRLSPADLELELTGEQAQEKGWSQADLRNWKLAVKMERAARRGN